MSNFQDKVQKVLLVVSLVAAFVSAISAALTSFQSEVGKHFPKKDEPIISDDRNETVEG